MGIADLKVGDRVAWHEFGMSFHGTVSDVRRQSHFGEDRIDVDVDQDDGSVWSFNDDHPGTLRLVETPDIDMVNHPAHYTGHPTIEAIDVLEHVQDYRLGTAMKYIWRVAFGGKENNRQDIEKSIWYLNRWLERNDAVSDA